MLKYTQIKEYLQNIILNNKKTIYRKNGLKDIEKSEYKVLEFGNANNCKDVR